jgi:GAF domain-containing protein
VKSNRPQSPRSLTKAQLIEDIQERLAPRIAAPEEENNRLRERLASAEALGPGLNEKQDLERLQRELTDALEQQTASSEILRVISRSPTNVQPVFDAIAENAGRLCDGLFVGVFRFDGELIHIAASARWTPAAAAELEQMYPMPPSRVQISGRAVLTRSVVHVRDLLDDPEYPRELAIAGGWRSALSVPMLRNGHPIGAISVFRGEAAPLSEKHIALLQTFADQAVIAIENARLFNETKKALEQQAATGEILRVISNSPTDVQPVFDAVAEAAARLCQSLDAAIFRREDDGLLAVAHHGPIPISTPTQGSIGEFTLPLNRGTVPGRAVLDGRTTHVIDLPAEVDEFPVGSELARLLDFRTSLTVPLMREGVALGCIVLRRTEAQLFTDRQVALLQTFADQTVIAIENVRLFTETREALERQTATSEILRVREFTHGS